MESFIVILQKLWDPVAKFVQEFFALFKVLNDFWNFQKHACLLCGNNIVALQLRIKPVEIYGFVIVFLFRKLKDLFHKLGSIIINLNIHHSLSDNKYVIMIQHGKKLFDVILLNGFQIKLSVHNLSVRVHRLVI